jgi:hypothetical protein
LAASFHLILSLLTYPAALRFLWVGCVSNWVAGYGVGTSQRAIQKGHEHDLGLNLRTAASYLVS